MGKYLIISILLISNFELPAQESFDALMTRRIISCRDIEYNSITLFENYLKENKEDSARSLLKYWENKCMMNERLQRAKILLSLKYNSYDESILDNNIVEYLIQYRERMNYRNYPYGVYDMNAFVEFDNFTKLLASNLESQYEKNTIENLLCRFYSNNLDSLFTEIKKPQYAFKKIQIEYLKEMDRCRKMLDYNWGFIGGMWIPTSDAAKLGIHPEFGIQGGIIDRLMTYDLTLAIRFVNSSNPYLARRVNSTGKIDTTTHFFGGYIGIDFGRIVYQGKDNEMHLLAGAGWDGFDAFEDPNYNDGINNAATVSSYNFNLGFGIRHYINITTYIGFQAKYNFTDYTLNHVVNFTGNTVTLRFIVGGIGYVKRNCLKRLQ